MEFPGVQISLALTLRELCSLRYSAVNEFEPVRKTLKLGAVSTIDNRRRCHC